MLLSDWEDFKPSVERLFYNSKTQQTFISYWRAFDGIFTAGHCLTECQLNTPPGTPHFDKWQHNMDGLDISTYGFDNFCPSLIDIYEGQEIIAMGYPAGSRNLEIRRGWVHIEREDGIWIGAIKNPAEPVVVGMSGGLVIGKDKATMKWGPIGVITHRNSPAKIDKDDKADESLDFVALSYVLRGDDKHEEPQIV